MNATKKPSKLDTLNADLVRASAALAEAEARLGPQIEAEQAKLAEMRKAYAKLDKARAASYTVVREVTETVGRRLDSQRPLIRAEITEKLGDRFPNADIARLVIEELRVRTNADSDMKAANERHDAAAKASDKAWRQINIMSSPGSDLSRLERELDRAKDVVTRLKTEIDRLPRYREAAKARRDEAKREDLRDADTAAARDFLKNLESK